MGEDTLDYTLRICIEGLDMLSDQNLEYNYYYPLERTKKASNVVNYVFLLSMYIPKSNIYGEEVVEFWGEASPLPPL